MFLLELVDYFISVFVRNFGLFCLFICSNYWIILSVNLFELWTILSLFCFTFSKYYCKRGGRIRFAKAKYQLISSVVTVSWTSRQSSDRNQQLPETPLPTPAHVFSTHTIVYITGRHVYIIAIDIHLYILLVVTYPFYIYWYWHTLVYITNNNIEYPLLVVNTLIYIISNDIHLYPFTRVTYACIDYFHWCSLVYITGSVMHLYTLPVVTYLCIHYTFVYPLLVVTYMCMLLVTYICIVYF